MARIGVISMIHAQNEKFVLAKVPASVATNATASSDAIDTLGWHNAIVRIAGQKVSASVASNFVAAVKLQHGNSTDASSFSDYTAAAFNGTTNSTAAASQFVIATNSTTTTPWCIQWNLSGILGTNGLARYLRVVYDSPLTGNNTNVVVAILSRGDQSPNSAAETGVTQIVSM